MADQKNWVETNINPLMQAEALDVIRGVRRMVAKISDHDGFSLSAETIWHCYGQANDDGTTATVSDVAYRMVTILDNIS